MPTRTSIDPPDTVAGPLDECDINFGDQDCWSGACPRQFTAVRALTRSFHLGRCCPRPRPWASRRSGRSNCRGLGIGRDDLALYRLVLIAATLGRVSSRGAGTGRNGAYILVMGRSCRSGCSRLQCCCERQRRAVGHEQDRREMAPGWRGNGDERKEARPDFTGRSACRCVAADVTIGRAAAAY